MSFEIARDGLTEANEDGPPPITTANDAGADHQASLASPTLSASSSVSGPASLHSHGRTWSRLSNQSRPQPRTNRFSLQFPIQLSGANTPVRAVSPTREPAAASSPDVQAALQGGAVSDSSSFLTLIASQERKVLELKEEVLRAEADLDKLKKQWASHEAKRKREDVKRLTKLQPLQTSSLPAAESEDDANGSNAWMHQEMARRKALLSRSNTTGGRTVMPGQRHTRALSLLSPGDNVRTPTAPRLPPPRQDSLRNVPLQSTEAVVTTARPPLVATASEPGDAARGSHRIADPNRNLDPTHRASIDQEALLRTSKKMASEFKDGLWTFWEDLKQATVGEDHHSVPPPRKKSSTQTLSALRKQGSKNSLRPSSRGSSTVSKASVETKRQSPPRKHSTASAIPDLADPSFWTNNGVVPPTQGTPPHVKKATTSKHSRQPSVKRLSAVSNDAWDTWDDSPEQSRSSSSVTSDTNTLPSSTVSGSPRSSGMNAFEPLEPTKRDSIPWPALKKSAGTLRKTASHLMSEWEKSLTPSPGEEYTGQEDYMGAGAEAAAFGAKKRIA